MKIKQMYEPRFFLNPVHNRKTGKYEIEQLIILNIWCDDGRMKYSTGEKINPIYWNEKNYQVDKTTKIEYRPINKRIEEINDSIESFVAGRKAGKQPILCEEMKAFLKNQDGKKSLPGAVKVVAEKSAEKLSFFQVLDKAIKDEESHGITDEGNEYTPGTVKNWRVVRGIVEGFKKDLTYEMIMAAEVQGGGKRTRNKVYDEFRKYCMEQEYSTSYTDRLVKDFKRIMALAEMPLPDSFKRLHIPDDEDNDKKFLNRAEIAKLYHFQDLTKSEEIIRDMYVVNCETAFRISDMRTLSKDDIRDGFISKKTKKSRFVKTQSVPLTATVKAIMEKYQGEFPHCYHENVVNKKIKEIAAAAGIERSEELTNHSARRSFITNMVDAGYKIRQVANMLGVSVAVIEKAYYKNNSVQTVKEVKHDEYFNTPLQKLA